MKVRPIVVLPAFLEKADALSKESRAKLVRILNILSINIRHQSLQCKKIKGSRKTLYECRLDQSMRIIYDIKSGILRCWYVGEHDEALSFATHNMSKSLYSDGPEIEDFEVKEIPEFFMLVQSYISHGEEPHTFQPLNLNEIINSDACFDEKTRSVFQKSINNIERHTRIDFPERCYLNFPSTLRIQLTIESPIDTVLKELVKVPFSEGAKQSILTVYVTAPAFKIAPSLAMMQVPIDQDSDIVIFGMTPIEPGKQVIEIEMFFRAERVGYFIVQSEVISHGE